ncbi:hypothetical protein [Desulfolutivibrio sulfoxidireducens]|uniref:hypothetical protein n=1 Tax=Desulfolutivibrio sulfoxidireducens TaxID=2773299 RepID=UPI00159E7842|nr:hypothetical protein [Desulfolutivibrio sulfoxidireducens]QLA17382.1 hypothetical protein GD605_15450 [Desulfolutivibrio sulfoxidireducens]
MNFKLKFVVFICVMISSFGMSCSDSGLSDSDLSSIHNGFRGIKWGDEFDTVSNKIVLTRTSFGGNDREPGYKILSGMPLIFEDVPVVIYFQFVKNKLNLVHIYGDKNNKDKLISTFYNLHGKPKIYPSRGTAIWQDMICSITLQENLADGGCLFSLLNNDNYMKLTGRMMRYY